MLRGSADGYWWSRRGLSPSVGTPPAPTREHVMHQAPVQRPMAWLSRVAFLPLPLSSAPAAAGTRGPCAAAASTHVRHAHRLRRTHAGGCRVQRGNNGRTGARQRIPYVASHSTLATFAHGSSRPPSTAMRQRLAPQDDGSPSSQSCVPPALPCLTPSDLISAAAGRSEGQCRRPPLQC